MIMRSGRTKVWATNSSRPRPRRLAQAPSRAVRGLAACSSSITARPRSPMGRVFAPDEVLPLRVDVALIRRLAVRHHHANRAAQMLLVEAECFGAPAGEIH